MDEPGEHEARADMVHLVSDQEVTCELTGERSYDRLIGVYRLLQKPTVGDRVFSGQARRVNRSGDAARSSVS